MVADIRATTICNLGVVVEGSISDESVSPGQGLVRCRGQLVIDGLITPAAGTVVQLAYERDGVITRIPRRLRVVSSFADPFRDVTTVQIGDKLVWLANKAPDRTAQRNAPSFPSDSSIGDTFNDQLDYPVPTQDDPNQLATVEYEYNGICWQPQNLSDTNQFRLDSSRVTAAEQNPTRPIDEQLRAPVTIAARTIAAKCLAGLGLGSSGLSLLSNHYTEDESQITGSYVSTLENLFSAEALVGFIDANEILRVVSIEKLAPGAGPYIDEVDIVDITPIGFGELPAELNELDASTVTGEDPTRNPDPEPPTANDFTVNSQEQGSTFTLTYSRILANCTYDYYRSSLNKVTVNVTAGSGCTATSNSSGVSVSVDAEFTGNASLSYTVSDGTNTSNSAQIQFEVYDANAEDDPASVTTDKPEELDVYPTISQAGTEVSSTTGRSQTATIKYRIRDNSNRLVEYSQIYLTTPSSFTREVYGKYGEVLARIETQSENGVSAAGNIFQQWLERQRNPVNLQVFQTTTTFYYYDYSFATTWPYTPPEENESPSFDTSGFPTSFQSPLSEQGTSCRLGGICDYGISPPPTPAEGDTFQYGECTYVFNGSAWEASDTPGDGELTTQEKGTGVLADSTKESRDEPILTASVTEKYEHSYYVIGAINWPTAEPEEIPIPPPLYDGSTLTERVTTYYSSSLTNTKQPVTRTSIISDKAYYKTVEGQQYLAQLSESVGKDLRENQEWLDSNPNAISAYVFLYYDDIIRTCLRFVNDDITTTINVGRPEVPRRTDGPSLLSNSTGTGPVLPRTYDPENGYQEEREAFKEQNAATQEQRKANATRAVQWGTRYGLSLQTVPWVLPQYPLSPFYVNMRSVVGAYRANGISIAFNRDGILANCDALLVGGVGGTGTPWFPLPEGTVLPLAPEPVIDGEAVYANSITTPEGFDPNNPGAIFDSLPTTESDTFTATLTPEAIVLSDPPSYRIAAGVRIGMAFDKLEWSLTPVIKDQALGVKVGITAIRETALRIPSSSLELLAQTPVVSTGYIARSSAVAVTMAAIAPTVAGGASVTVPNAGISIQAGLEPIVPRVANSVFTPSAAVVILSEAPEIRTGASVTAPAAVVTVTAQTPRAGGNLGDNFGLTALLADDLLELL